MSAASMTKLATTKLHYSKELNALGFNLQLQVHDELIGECPRENAEQVAELLTSIMKDAAKPVVTVPFKCDAAITGAWYEDKYSAKIQKEYKEYLKSGKSEEEAFNLTHQNYIECTPEQLHYLINL